MLPPHDDDGGAELPSSEVRSCSRAARPVAPAPSARVFSRSSRSEDGGGDLLFVDGDDLVDVALDDGEA